ncbi:5653_t:CDS:2 [Entrophospora sp. SA101]|nr:5653_t:CDS:2 [Entrophospora sp. SA101]
MPPEKRTKGSDDEEKIKKRKSLTFLEKKEVCEWKRDHPSYNLDEIAKKFGISKSQAATHFAERLQVTSFGGSDGWLTKFKARYNIKQYNKAGEANSAPLETLNDERVILREVIGEYDLCDVYNIDETGC